MLVRIGVDSGARAARARESKSSFNRKMLIFKGKINTIPLALNIINHMISAPWLNRDNSTRI